MDMEEEVLAFGETAVWSSAMYAVVRSVGQAWTRRLLRQGKSMFAAIS